MLVLSRKKEQTIVINEDIEIKVIFLSKERVKLGIIAPKHITVDRGEIHEQKYSSEGDKND
jgi:carbon storage regulator